MNELTFVKTYKFVVPLKKFLATKKNQQKILTKLRTIWKVIQNIIVKELKSSLSIPIKS